MKPRVFIGSSSEGLSIAEEIQLGLQYVAGCRLWTQWVCRPSLNVLDELVGRAKEYDYAIFVLTPDDVVTRRGRVGKVPRGNVILELGLFLGMLGRDRIFMVCNRDAQMDLPSNLEGVTTVSYGICAGNDLSAAMGSACTQLKKAMML
ncbi:nucleotide-binding protein [Sorangium sp. So ce302]|uniref:TIR domain-containing protein n=1 Tax=Sorangium sp. So ce302 TaxID=3133297 RepID=UPI003F640926